MIVSRAALAGLACKAKYVKPAPATAPLKSMAKNATTPINIHNQRLFILNLSCSIVKGIIICEPSYSEQLILSTCTKVLGTCCNKNEK
jgi:hypothetical protein